MKYKALFGELFNQPHLILPDKLADIQRFLEARSAGVTIKGKAVQQPKPYALNALEHGAVGPLEAIGNSGTQKFVAVLPLFGTTWQHGGMEMAASGGTSTEAFAAEFSKLLHTPSIKTIVIECHSPGGQVWGTQELSDLIYASRARKRVVGSVNSQCASAALWILTAVQEISITPGGDMGSIGVVTAHEDISKAEEKAGVKTTLIAYPEKKVAGHSFAPLPDDVRGEFMEKIKSTYLRFITGVARNRGVTTSAVETKFGGGGMLRAQAAVAAGLADRVETKADLLRREVRLLQSKVESRKSVANQLAIARLKGDF